MTPIDERVRRVPGLPSFSGRLGAVALLALLGTATATYGAVDRAGARSASPARADRPVLVVPDVRGQPHVFAKGILEDAGFTWRVRGRVGHAGDRVRTQWPAAGTRMRDTGSPRVVVQLAATSPDRPRHAAHRPSAGAAPTSLVGQQSKPRARNQPADRHAATARPKRPRRHAGSPRVAAGKKPHSTRPASRHRVRPPALRRMWARPGTRGPVERRVVGRPDAWLSAIAARSGSAAVDPRTAIARALGLRLVWQARDPGRAAARLSGLESSSS